MRVLGYCTGCRKPKPVRARLVGRGVPTGLCSTCEERENRPTDLVIYVPAPEAEPPVPPFSALVGRGGGRIVDEVAWEPGVRGGVANLAVYEAMVARAADRLLRGSPGRRTSTRAADLVPVGVFDARRERIVRIDDRAALDRWLGRRDDR